MLKIRLNMSWYLNKVPPRLQIGLARNIVTSTLHLHRTRIRKYFTKQIHTRSLA